MDEKKKKFLESLSEHGGIISSACQDVKMSRPTFYNWCKNDPEFKAAADDITETQIDFVESKLLSLIDAGDTTAIIFYLKTKGKKRGYTEKPLPPPLPTPPPAVIEDDRSLQRRIENKKRYIIDLLKKEKKYSPDMSYQVTVAAQLSIKVDMLAQEIFSESHRAVTIEYSREGNEREIVSAKEKLYLDYIQQQQLALRRLGMNMDAKERKTFDDGFSEFMNAMNEAKADD